jgi:hypothetical protein
VENNQRNLNDDTRSKQVEHVMKIYMDTTKTRRGGGDKDRG